MQNLRARPYDPANGRFIGLDPFAGNMQDPQSLHKYAYVHGDPIGNIDPTGLMSLGSMIATAKIYAGSLAMSMTSGWYTLTAVYGAAGYVMLHQELIELFSSVRSLATGTNAEGESLTPGGYLFAMALVAVTFVPGDFADDALRKIAYYRSARNMPIEYTGDRAADGVAAMLRVDGKDYVSHNGWISDAGETLADVKDEMASLGVSANAITPTHAEGGVFMKALRDGASATKAHLFVDATFCKPCGKNKGLRAFAEALGLDELVVYIRLSNGHVIEGLYDLRNTIDS